MQAILSSVSVNAVILVLLNLHSWFPLVLLCAGYSVLSVTLVCFALLSRGFCFCLVTFMVTNLLGNLQGSLSTGSMRRFYDWVLLFWIASFIAFFATFVSCLSCFRVAFGLRSRTIFLEIGNYFILPLHRLSILFAHFCYGRVARFCDGVRR